MSDGLVRDVRYAARLLWRSKGFTSVAVLLLSIGIGANTAIFGLLDHLVFRPLPVERPNELVYLRDPSFSYPIFQEVRARGSMFSGVFAWTGYDLSVAWDREPEQLRGLLVSGDFYRTLGVGTLLGRPLTQADDGHTSAVLSYDAWRRIFGRDPSIIGRVIRVERTPFTVVGVTHPHFFGVAAGENPAITIPVTTLPLIRPEEHDILSRGSNAWLHIMGRVRSDQTLQQADAAFQVIWRRVLDATVSSTLPAKPKERFLARKTGLVEGATGFSRVRRQFTTPLLAIMALVGIVLLLACTNLAGLVLTRTTGRRREIALRMALGAGRGRVARQLTIESFLLSLAGSAVGLLLAMWVSALLVALISTSETAVHISLTPDWRVAGFAAGAGLLTALWFGLAPALRAVHLDPAPALQEGGRTMTGGGGRMGRVLVAAQMALSLSLVAAAGLLVASLAKILDRDPGLDTKKIMLALPDPISSGYQAERLSRYFDNGLEAIRALPSVEAASASWMPPLSATSGVWTDFAATGAGRVEEDGAKTYVNAVAPQYFATVGTPLLSGRDFTSFDRIGSAPVAIVNQTFAKDLFPGGNAIGSTISIGRGPGLQRMQVIGIVADSRYQTLNEPVRRVVYAAVAQVAPEANLTVAVRMRADPAQVAADVRSALARIDGQVPLRTQTLETRIRESLVKERVLAALSVFFAAAAIALAAIGLYGLIAYRMAQRTSEIGIRMTLGATRADVMRLAAGEAMAPMIAGVVAGILLIRVFGRSLSALLYELAPADPTVLACSAGLLLTAGALAVAIPAYRASRLDPAAALRTS